MKCSNCKVDLDSMTIKVDGKYKRILMHPDLPASKDCPFLNHGLKVSIEIIDDFLNDKFQEEMNNNQGDDVLKEERSTKEETLLSLNGTDEEKAKRGLSEGTFTIEDFDRIKERLIEKWI